MNRFRSVRLLLMTVSVLFSGCSGSTKNSPVPETDELLPEVDVQTRSFALGFTPWPYDATLEAINFVNDEIVSRGDIIAHHLDGGIPWQEALDETSLPAAVEDEINSRVANTPADKLVYLTVSPFNIARDNIAAYWNDSGTGQPLNPPWDDRDFDSAEVIQAYTNFAKHAIDRLNPKYFNLALEASELAINNAESFDKFVVFVEAVSASLRAEYPDLELMLSVAMKSPGSTGANIINAQLPRIVQYVDVVGVSIYPFAFFEHSGKGDPSNLPVDWLSQINTIAAGKPLAITETGWIAERLTISNFTLDVAADENNQDAYLQVLFEAANNLEMQFVIWFSIVDYDALWNGVLGQDDVSRIWRDTGLYDENLSPRVGLARWQEQLDVEYAE